ncbi:hypothetical protein [Streptosporangium sp. NBC_01756]|uniref:hypothetical protein n=1 Tax=Streptosporangium sp. NBC_01756 TaxID=2975950 RepID=UPI002DD83144|nr:hypothetical protein [Streptosporangium sp. NBC_01756]WSC84784.1 hypothetical protein OIE48_31050 [Streptosporangium sp. NBC_01756]
MDAARDNPRGRPEVTDDDMLTFALALGDGGVPRRPAIAVELTVSTGKNAW